MFLLHAVDYFKCLTKVREIIARILQEYEDLINISAKPQKCRNCTSDVFRGHKPYFTSLFIFISLCLRLESFLKAFFILQKLDCTLLALSTPIF